MEEDYGCADGWHTYSGRVCPQCGRISCYDCASGHSGFGPYSARNEALQCPACGTWSRFSGSFEGMRCSQYGALTTADGDAICAISEQTVYLGAESGYTTRAISGVPEAREMVSLHLVALRAADLVDRDLRHLERGE